jgi:hypothetical protein
MQVVQQLEIQLAKERDRLSAMMQHLHNKHRAQLSIRLPPALPSMIKLLHDNNTNNDDNCGVLNLGPNGLSRNSGQSPPNHHMIDDKIPIRKSSSTPPLDTSPTSLGSISIGRRRLSDKSSSLPTGLGLNSANSNNSNNNMPNNNSNSNNSEIRDNCNINVSTGQSSNPTSLPDSPARRRIAERSNLDITEGERVAKHFAKPFLSKDSEFQVLSIG